MMIGLLRRGWIAALLGSVSLTVSAAGGELRIEPEGEHGLEITGDSAVINVRSKRGIGRATVPFIRRKLAGAGSWSVCTSAGWNISKFPTATFPWPLP